MYKAFDTFSLILDTDGQFESTIVTVYVTTT